MNVTLGAVGSVNVITGSRDGLSADEYAALCKDRIINVSHTAPPELRDQAQTYARDIERVVREYMRKAVSSDRQTISKALLQAGHPELAKMILEI